MVGERGYASHGFRDHIWKAGARPAIPTKRNEAPVACPSWVCNNRSIVERLWARLKKWRGLRRPCRPGRARSSPASGVVTPTFGGVIGDLLGGESPMILSREIYASAAGADAAVFTDLIPLDAPRAFAQGTGFTVALLVRAASLRFGLTLPRYRPRAGLPYS